MILGSNNFWQADKYFQELRKQASNSRRKEFQDCIKVSIFLRFGQPEAALKLARQILDNNNTSYYASLRAKKIEQSLAWFPEIADEDYRRCYRFHKKYRKKTYSLDYNAKYAAKLFNLPWPIKTQRQRKRR